MMLRVRLHSIVLGIGGQFQEEGEMDEIPLAMEPVLDCKRYIDHF